MKSVTYVEIDVDFCANTYGLAPCTASIPTTGAAKCYNTAKTCQDRPHFINSPVTLRFAMPTAYLPTDIDAIPSIKSVSFTPAVLNAGVDLGQRATVSVSFTDHPHPDTGTGFDKYVTERPYTPFAQGSFFGKFRSRQPYLRGRPFRLIRGEVGQALSAMETRHYLIDSFTGPNTDGTYTLVAKDVLKLADDDRSLAPALSNGSLLSNITAIATSATLSPTGIGNSEYPASGVVAIGGKELCTFTRSGDVVTLTRGQFNTTAAAFTAGDRMQLCLQYSAADPAVIIRDLFVTYGGISSSYIDLTAWQLEIATYLARVYTALICEPTGINKLVSELVEQAGLAIWWDDLAQQLRLQVLRQITTDAAVFDQDNTLQGTLQIQEQPDKRVSEVWTYFGLRNPLEPIDRTDNYRSTEVTPDLQAATDYGSSMVKVIYSRWIPQFGNSIAARLNDLQLGRYRDPPRLFSFSILRDTVGLPALGAGYQLESWALQDAAGAAVAVPVQATQVDPEADVINVRAEEALFTQYDTSFLTDRVITIDANTLDFNLKTVHDSLYPAITSADLGSPSTNIICIVAAGAIVGSSSASTPAFDVGAWPLLPPIKVTVQGRIQGHGGQGGNAAHTPAQPANGQAGGPALYTRVAIQLDDSAGEVWGGGGGGAGARGGVVVGGVPTLDIGGGGGAGSDPGAGGAGATSAGISGTTEAGGDDNYHDHGGGGPGQAGHAGAHSGTATGGAAGAAVDGISHVTHVGATGDERGGTIN